MELAINNSKNTLSVSDAVFGREFSEDLVHQVVVSTTFFVLRDLLPPVSAFAVGAPFSLVLGMAVAALLYHTVEEPLEKRLRHTRPRPEMSAARTCSRTTRSSGGGSLAEAARRPSPRPVARPRPC